LFALHITEFQQWLRDIMKGGSNMADQIDRLLTQQQVVDLTNMSKAYFEQARHRGNSELVYIKIGRAVRYRISDVQRWIESNVVGAGI